MALKRISVIGVSGSGKSTLAKRLSSLLGLPHIELDTYLYHQNGIKKDTDSFRKEVKQAIGQDGWVTEGISYKMADIVWPKSDMLIWLDPPLYKLYYRVIKRLLRRLFNSEPLPSGHHANLKREFSKHGVLRNLHKIYNNIHREYPKQIEKIGGKNLNVVRIKDKNDLKEICTYIESTSSN